MASEVAYYPKREPEIENWEIIHVGRKPIINPQMDQACREIGIETINKLNHGGAKMHNGRCYRPTNRDEILNTGILELAESDYATLLGFRKLYPRLERPITCAAAGIILTADQKVVVGKRPNQSYTLIGGGLQPDEMEIKEPRDIIKTLYKELEEEINVTPEHLLEDPQFLGILDNRYGITFTFAVNLSKSPHEVMEIFQDRQEDEIETLEFLTPDEFEEFSARSGGFWSVLPRLSTSK